MNDKRISEIKTEFFNSGVIPFERKEMKAYHSATNEICSVFSSLSANSFVGRLEPDVYENSIKEETSLDVFKLHLMLISREYVEHRKVNPNLTETWISLSDSILKLGLEKITDVIDDVLNKYHLQDMKSKICLAFSSKVLWENQETLLEIKKLKDYGVKVAITGVGERLCPLIVLSELKADYVSLTKELKMSEEENVKNFVHSLIEYLKTMGYVVYAECKDEEKSLYRRLGVNACWVL